MIVFSPFLNMLFCLVFLRVIPISLSLGPTKEFCKFMHFQVIY